MAKRTKRWKMGKYTMIEGRRISQLQINEATMPRRSGRYSGTSIGRDGKGYFVMTHRCRSKSYPAAVKIPVSRIRFVRSTG